jgi:hypothetical protein
MKFAKKCLLAATVLAAISTTAMAAPKQLTEAEMAKVVAGKQSDGVADLYVNSKTGQTSYVDTGATVNSKNKIYITTVGWSSGTN